jgi:hypothetical protein
MPYGIIKIDTVTFTDAGVDKSVSISGLVQNPTFSGNVTVTGTLSGVTVTGTTANFTSGNFTNISGGTHTITSGVFAAGSAASPSITFTGDLNTGIYSPGADQVAISTGGSGRLFINSNGDVGVGTGGTQGTKLHAVGGNIWSGNFYEVGRFQKSSGTAISLGYDNSDYVATVGAYSHDGTPSNLSFWTYPGSGAVQERLRITSAGLVGVGTTPDSPLHVVGTSGTGLRIGYTNNTNYFDANTQIFRSNNATTTYGQWDSSGRLLVGTSSSRSDLVGLSPQIQLEGATQSATSLSLTRNEATSAGPALLLAKSRGTTAGAATVVQSGDTLGGVYFMGADGTNIEIGAQITGEVDATPGNNDLPSRLVFSTTADGASSPTERMRILNSGDVLINTTTKLASANAALHVYRNTGSSIIVQQADPSSDTISVWNSAPSGDNRFIVFYTEGSITARGNIDYNRAAGQVRYNVTSDQRLKDEIEDAPSALFTLKEIKVRSYKWKETGYKIPYGFVAQELNATLPDAVKRGDHGEQVSDVWAVDNGKLVPLLTKALQEAMERIETLEQRLNDAGIN